MDSLDSTQLIQVLQKRFGLSAFRPGQLEIISRLLSKRHTVGILPTGGGKSLCYQLPAVILPNLTIVVSPLLALIREQVETLNGRGIHAVRIDSTLDVAQYQSVVQSLRENKAKLLYVAPERLFNERFRELLGTLSVDLLAIDEAHCISQWGHNFRPDYLRLAGVAREFKIPTVLALTATATPQVADDIRSTFGVSTEDQIRTSSFRPNLSIEFSSCAGNTKNDRLCKLLKRNTGPAIVYTTLQATSEQISAYLAERGFDASCYHAGMEDEARRNVQDHFMNSPAAVVVATIAFGMGIDKSNIRTIVHYNMSNGLENYAQEIGRAGRDGNPSVCHTFLDASDRIVLQNFAHGDLPDQSSVAALIRFITNQPEESYLSYYNLAHEYDIRDNVLRTIFTYLELDGYLESIGPRYDKYRFKIFKPLHWIVDQFKDERKAFANAVLSMTVTKKVWTDINVTIASQRLNQPRKRIVAMLEHFAEKGWIDLQPSGIMFGYRRGTAINDSTSVANSIYTRLSELESRSLTRIDQLVELAQSESCNAQRLALHFGDSLSEPCGRCTACIHPNASPSIDFDVSGKLGTSITSQIPALRNQYPAELESNRQMAKFLCGISSPQSVRKRLTKHDYYGCCTHLPFDLVFNLLNKLAAK